VVPRMVRVATELEPGACLIVYLECDKGPARPVEWARSANAMGNSRDRGASDLSP
jgi:hypothetical protein